jgi:hypothetical protein
VGGFLAHFVGNRRSEKTGGERGHGIRERGVIMASGLMAGGALGGVLGAALRLFPSFHEDWIKTPFYANDPGLAIRFRRAVSSVLCVYVWYGSIAASSTEPRP